MSRFSQIPADRAVGYVLRGVIAFVLFVLVTFGAFNLLENVDANEIVVVQARGSGKLSFHTSPGLICQCFGKLTSYDRRRNYVTDQAVQFSEGGHGVMEKVSVQWEMPLDPANLTELHTQFGASDVIEQSLVAPIVRKVVYLTGSLMTSRESYAERRSYLISFVEDQIAHGVYKTVTREVRQEDPLTKAEKLVKVVDIVQKDGQPDRQEVSSLQRFGIRTSNFAFDKLAYDEKVQAQIVQQQQIAMDVETAIGNAKKAEQDKITTEQRGAANAAAAKWEQEVLKAKAVTQAEQGLAVQKLAVQTADLYKQEQTLKGEADAAYRRKVLEADGALAAKLATYEKVNETWATAFQNYAGQLVPNVVMGQQGGTGLSSAQSFMDLLTAKTALDLGLSAKPAVK
jgi:hypothetical protein